VVFHYFSFQCFAVGTSAKRKNKLAGKTKLILRVILTFILCATCFLSHAQNFTNKGREFWVGYGHNQLFTSAGNSQNMVVYLSAEQSATVTVSIPGTTWTKNYVIAANTVIVSDIIPKSGAEDCRLTDEGLFQKAVHIVSNIPIVAYAHVYGNLSSGAVMLLPVETYGYTYSSLNTSQEYDTDCYSWFMWWQLKIIRGCASRLPRERRKTGR
jgi:hypothetical protein